jgi:hypothetical protein
MRVDNFLANTAGGEEFLTGKPSRIVRGQEHCDRRDIANHTCPSQGSLRDEAFLQVRADDASAVRTSVSTTPGLIVFTRIFRGPSSRARTPVMASRAPLVAV